MQNVSSNEKSEGKKAPISSQQIFSYNDPKLENENQNQDESCIDEDEVDMSFDNESYQNNSGALASDLETGGSKNASLRNQRAAVADHAEQSAQHSAEDGQSNRSFSNNEEEERI